MIQFNRNCFIFLSIFLIKLILAENPDLKTEWSHKYLGCPKQMIFGSPSERNEKLNDLIVIVSDNDTLSTLSMNYGTIGWRHLFGNTDTEVKGVTTNKAIFTIHSDGIVRGFRKLSGEMFYEELLNNVVSKNFAIYTLDSFNIVAIFDNKAYIINIREKSHNAYTLHLKENENCIPVGVTSSETDYHLIFSVSNVIHILNIEKDDLTVFTVKKVDEMIIDNETCDISGTYILCKSGEHLKYYDMKKVTNYDIDGNLVDKILSLTDTGIFAISGKTFSEVLNFNEQSSSIFKRTSSEIFVASTKEKGYFAIVEDKNMFSLYDINKLNEPIFSANLESSKDAILSNIRNIFFTIKKNDNNIGAYVAKVGDDCQIDFYETLNGVEFSKEWTRYEDLSYISKSEFVDLPLSEMDMLFEKEFSNTNGDILGNFTLRVTSQIEQAQTLVRKYLKHASKFIQKFNFKSLTTADFMSGLKNKKEESYDEDQPLERDYFKFKKYIIVTTLKGSIYAINNENGNIIWKRSIGSNFMPFTDILNNNVVPLFVQRTTDSSMFHNQASVVYNIAGGKTGILAFNMITGEILDRKVINKKVIRIEQIPKQNSQRMKNLILFFGEQPHDIEYYPSLKEADYLLFDKPFYLLWINKETGQLRGTRFDFVKKSLQTVWIVNRNVENEYITNIVSKLPNEKTQSLGYVIGHNNVLYKYLNPHMIAIAFADKKNNHATEIIILDTITGKSLYTSKLKNAQAPIKMVLCDNWLALSYYNYKTRRNQMSIVELFDGEDFKDTPTINSWSKSFPSNFSVQSYLFPQGITAFSVTRTDLGLTTRSLLVSMPYGSIAQISKRQLDGRRVFDVTQEQREEGLVPYIPEIIFTPDQYVTNNNTVLQIRQIDSHSAGLESVSHIFAYGKDLYCTFIHPSGKFDMLHDDFNYHLIIVILVSLVLGSIFSRYKANYYSLKQSWM